MPDCVLETYSYLQWPLLVYNHDHYSYSSLLVLELSNSADRVVYAHGTLASTNAMIYMWRVRAAASLRTVHTSVYIYTYTVMYYVYCTCTVYVRTGTWYSPSQPAPARYVHVSIIKPV